MFWTTADERLEAHKEMGPNRIAYYTAVAAGWLVRRNQRRGGVSGFDDITCG